MRLLVLRKRFPCCWQPIEVSWCFMVDVLSELMGGEVFEVNHPTFRQCRLLHLYILVVAYVVNDMQ